MVMDRKEEVLQAAFHLFAEKGYHLSLSDIADEIGIKTPSLYSHFNNKDEIIYLMVEKETIKLFEHMTECVQAIRDQGCRLILKEVFFETMAYNGLERLRVLRRLPFIEKDSLRGRCIGLMREREMGFLGLLSQVVREGVQNGEIFEELEHSALISFMAMLQGTLDGKLLYAGFADMQEFYEKSWECFWNGIKKRTKSNCECFNNRA